MKKCGLLLILFLGTCQLFAQNNKYWVRFKDKAHNTHSLSNPNSFLSQKSIDRRTKQGIALNETDLPITQSYIDSLAPYIGTLNHRIKWFNMVVVDIPQVISLRTDTVAKRDTIYTTDTFSVTIYDSIIFYNYIEVNGQAYTHKLQIIDPQPIVVHDTFVHAGPVYIRDTVFLTDVITGNLFDSIKQLGFVDSIGPIYHNPLKRTKRKFETVTQVDQRISYPSPYGAAYHQINMLNGDLLHQLGYKGQGITVSVMDNGFPNVNTQSPYSTANILGTWDFVDNEADVYNQGSHGQNVFSCMAANAVDTFIGTAPAADYYLLATEDTKAEWIMEEYNWAAGAEYADSAGAQIFTTSLGYTEFDSDSGNHTYSDLNGHSTVITQAANKAFGKGILVINSAGNEGAKSWRYIAAPADGDSVMAIGAVDSARTIANFSSRGPNAAGLIRPVVCAQGSNVYILNNSGRPSLSSGTSFSCPIIAGCAASLWSAFPDKSARDIYDAIVISADRFWTPDNNYGYGIPNFYNAYLFLKTDYNSGILNTTGKAVIYPNPFTNELNVSFYNETEGEHKIELFDLQGRKVYSNSLYLRNKTFDIIRIDAGTLNAGEYLLRIDGNKATTQHVLKLK
jgi:hypothetical protein